MNGGLAFSVAALALATLGACSKASETCEFRPANGPYDNGVVKGWYRPGDLPTGKCSDEGCTLSVTVNPCCDRQSPEVRQYDCTCSAAAWSCKLVSQGAGYCGDGGAPDPYNALDPRCVSK